MTNLSYNDIKKEFVDFLAVHEHLVLSTCSKNKVTSRTVCYSNDDFTIYLLIGKRSNKYKQIEENHNIAICIDNLQIEGTAKILGHPLEEQNKPLTKGFESKHSFYFKRFAHFKAASLVEIKCLRMKQWKFEVGRDIYYCVDVEKMKACKHA